MIGELLGSLSEDEWTLTEDRLDRSHVRFQEAVLTLGNGFLGSRGSLEEGIEEGYAATYLAGVYDRSGGQSFAIVNAPNPLLVEIHVNGTRLSADEMETVEHRRVLDMKKAVLSRRTVFLHNGRSYEYESARFFSLDDMHIGQLRVSFRSLDDDAHVLVRHITDGTTRNEMHAVGGARKHYQVTQTEGLDAVVSYLEAKTNDLHTVIGIASAVDLTARGAVADLNVARLVDEESAVIQHSFTAQKGIRYLFDRHIAIHTSRETRGEVREACLGGVERARARGALSLLQGHVSRWQQRWHIADIDIEGDPGIQKALRFAMYHLLVAAPSRDIDVSMAPKGLSGEWYQGHIFWDTEIFMLPFFVYTHPELAKHLLLYRARRLEQARERALTHNYRGALWPWESADSGREETPDTWVNLDGSILPVYNAKREHHIACDIVYAVGLYHLHTGDDEFMLHHGLSMVFETARFWASRVTHDAANDRYEIQLVIGPNEFQEGVDNNSYTNGMARWTLRYACRLYDDVKDRYPGQMQRVANELGLSGEEVRRWKLVADKIVLLKSDDGLLEEFEGYFQKRDVSITERDEQGMPVWPSDVTLNRVKETQLVKQADVALLLCLLSDEFSLDAKRVNFDYYEPRTTHVSSLSIMSYAILASELGDADKAYAYLHHAANSDLENIHGNTELGVHAAELGGAWQIAVRGIAGVRVRDGSLSVDPSLPEHWERMRFRVWFKGSLLELVISEGSVEVSMLEGREAMGMYILGKKQILRPGDAARVEG